MKTHGWKDTSSFDQRDQVRTPKEFTYQTSKLRITVHRKIHCGDLWFFSCHELGLRDRELLAVTSDQAKKEALRDVRCHVMSLMDELGKPT